MVQTSLFSNRFIFELRVIYRQIFDLEYYLLGDLNCNLPSPTPDENTHRLLEISDLDGLKQLINEPKRVTESSSTLIDLIYTIYVDRVGCSGVSHIAISDHSLVYVYRKISSDLPSTGHSSISYRSFRNFDRENFRNEISQQDWSFNESEYLNLAWSNWKTKLLRAVNSHAPFRTRRTKLNKTPWINSALKKVSAVAMLLKGKRWKQRILKTGAIKESSEIESTIKWKPLRHPIITIVLFSLKEMFEGLGKLLNNLMSRCQNNQIVKDVKVYGISICNSNEISNAFNEHFSTIGPRLAREIPLTSDEESIYLENSAENYNKFCFRPATTSDVFTLLNRLSKTKATGLDNISVRLIRECADIISGPLCDLFNKSLMSGIFSWRLEMCQSDSVV